tara:strand:- start:590 stop:757 length:168 start_codon:yes stop_codon:yes gene_type:complete
MKYKISKKKAEEILLIMWENFEIPSNFTEDHSEHDQAVIYTRVHGYFDYDDFWDI